MEEHLEKKGIKANLESLRSRVKGRKSIGDLEGNQDRLASKALDDESGSEMEDVDDVRIGRKRKRSMSDSSDQYDALSGRNKSINPSTGKKRRSLTPAQLKITAQSKVRSMSKGRREGSVP